MQVLPDVLASNLAIVFCGTGAGRKSAEVGAYYASSGNQFWKTLYAVGLTPRRLEPHEYREVSAHRIGLTDIAKEHVGQDTEIDLQHVDATALRERIAACAPRILAFTSKRAASLFFGRPTGYIAYGFQQETIDGTRIFVLTSPSGAAGRHWQVGPWEELARAATAAKF